MVATRVTHGTERRNDERLATMELNKAARTTDTLSVPSLEVT